MAVKRVTNEHPHDYGLDEIVASHAFIHFERMDRNHVWFRIYCGREVVDVNLGSRTIIKAHVQRWTEKRKRRAPPRGER